mgnify:CR=1 FL=1
MKDEEKVNSEQTSEGLPASETSVETPSVEEQLSKLQAECSALHDQLVRRQADFENYRKRVEREQKEFRQHAEAELILALLPVLDAFERALNAPVENPNNEEYRKGVELIYKQLVDTLARRGLKPVKALGEIFDPFLHHALERIESTDYRDQEIIAELQRGYTFKDRLLRPALVRVAVHPRGATEAVEAGTPPTSAMEPEREDD